MRLTAVLTPAYEGGFVALNPETGTTTEGSTLQTALENLREATELYLEEFPSQLKGETWMGSFEVKPALKRGRRKAKRA